MAAGDRAAEQSKVAAARVEKLRKQLEQAERSAHAWSIGAAGEAMVADRLSALEPAGWLTLHDVHWPGRPKANLDHVLIGPGGIVVVDAKNWSGDVRLRDGILRQNGYAREREIAGVLQQSAAVAACLEPDHRRLVQGWICLVGQPALQGRTTSGIRIEGLDTLHAAVAGLPDVLDPSLVPTIHGSLQGLLGGPASPQLLTTALLNNDDAAAAALRQWRARPAPSALVPVPAPAARNDVPAGNPPRKSRSLGALKILLPVTLVLIGVSLVLNFAAHYRPAAPAVPNPPPGISQTVPAR